MPTLMGANNQARRDPIVRPYSEFATTYDATLGVPYFLGARKAFEELVKRYGVNFRSAADLGCGTGIFARYLSSCWGVPMLAVDRSPEMLRMAMRNCTDCEVGFLQQDFRCLQLTKQQWDEMLQRAARAGSPEEARAIAGRARQQNLGWRLYKALQRYGRWAQPYGYPIQLFGPWTRTEGPWMHISDRLLQAHRDHIHVAK
jgi:hypothetical protein